MDSIVKVGDLKFIDGEGRIVVEIIPDEYEGEPRNWVKFDNGLFLWEDNVDE